MRENKENGKMTDKALVKSQLDENFICIFLNVIFIRFIFMFLLIDYVIYVWAKIFKPPSNSRGTISQSKPS